MDNASDHSADLDPLIRSVLSVTTRSVLIFCAAFMISWFVFLVSGVIYFEVMLD